MNTKTFFPVLGTALLTLPAIAQQRPNVIIIISDQWSTSIADGSGNYINVARTPNVDRLASEGIRFTQSYSSYPLSTPARACFYTGMYSHHNKATFNEDLKKLAGNTPADLPTMGELFYNAGYETAYFGKQHAANYAKQGVENFGSYEFSDGGMLAEGSAYDQIFVRDAIKFLREDHDKPFYMNVSLINPHDICKVLGGKVKGATFADAIFFCREDDEPYLRSQNRASLPKNFNVPYTSGMILDKDYMYEETFNMPENDWKRYISTYCLLLENTDWLIGLLLDAIDETGLANNTIVMFTTDHGDMMASHKLIAKTTFYEESAKTMMCIRYPEKIKAGSTDDKTLVGSIDIMPTLLDLCDIKIPDALDGKSFKRQCFGKKGKDHKILYSVNYFGRMVRFRDYKLCKSLIYDKEYYILFDLKNDPQESTNVFDKPGYEKVSAEGKAMLDNWIETENIGMTFDRPRPNKKK